MNGVERFRITRELVKDSLFLGCKNIAGVDVAMFFEKFQCVDVANAEKVKAAALSNVFDEEKRSSRCSSIDHVVQDQDKVYIFGESSKCMLADFLFRSRPERRLVGALAYELVDIVNSLHKCGVIHNSISLERFSVCSDGSLLLFPNPVKAFHRSIPDGIKNSSDRYVADRHMAAVLLDSVLSGNDCSGRYAYVDWLSENANKLLRNSIEGKGVADVSELLGSLGRYEKYRVKLNDVLRGYYSKEYGTGSSADKMPLGFTEKEIAMNRRGKKSKFGVYALAAAAFVAICAGSILYYGRFERESVIKYPADSSSTVLHGSETGNVETPAEDTSRYQEDSVYETVKDKVYETVKNGLYKPSIGHTRLVDAADKVLQAPDTTLINDTTFGKGVVKDSLGGEDNVDEEKSGLIDVFKNDSVKEQPEKKEDTGRLDNIFR